MKRAAFILMVLYFCSGLAHAWEKSFPRITYGAEWGYIAVFYSGYHYNFFAPEGYRVDPRGYEFTYDSNAEAYLHFGYNVSSRLNVALYMGLSAVHDYHMTVPVSIRATWFRGEDYEKDRWFWFADVGSGLSIKKKPQEIYNAKLGTGYRLSLSRSTKLDIHMSIRSSYTRPDIYYYGTPVERDKINRNNAYLSALALGMSLTF